jgi:RNA 2',3'-cyclic 3'-phosphodiesterase
MISARKSGAAVRSFFAVALPAPAREACRALAQDLAGARHGHGVRWSRPEGYHVTLRFLGNVERERVPELVKRVAERVGTAAPFRVRLGAVCAFPPGRSPRVIAVAVEPEGPLAALAARVEEGVVAAGLAPERRRFRAHLTIGRVRGRRIPPLEGMAVPGASAIDVCEVVLYRSDLDREGSVYTELESIALGAAASSDSDAGPTSGPGQPSPPSIQPKET